MGCRYLVWKCIVSRWRKDRASLLTRNLSVEFTVDAGIAMLANTPAEGEKNATEAQLEMNQCISATDDATGSKNETKTKRVFSHQCA